jgi:O-antigen ligase
MYTQKFAGSSMLNVQSRFDTWLYYLRGTFSDQSAFLLGHNVPPDRKIWPSAHNYYLDFIYNFGFIAALVIIGLVIFTVIQLCRNRKHILMSPAMLGLTIVVLFLLIPDSLLKVGMRQPYPGIITFFFWGLLLARIASLQTADKSA